MRHVPTLLRRELGAYFLSPMAYIILLCFQVIAAIDFYQLVEMLSLPQLDLALRVDPMIGYVASNWMFWLALLFAIPALTMRLLAEERRTGTIEGLLTVPVTGTEIVVAKWLAGTLMFLATLVPFAIYLPFLWRVGRFELDLGPLAALAIGLVSLGSMLVAIGLLVSSLMKNQVESAVICFVIVLMLLLITLVHQFVGPRYEWGEALAHLSIYQHVSEFASGRIDLRILALHASVTIVALWCSVLALEYRRGT